MTDKEKIQKEKKKRTTSSNRPDVRITTGRKLPEPGLENLQKFPASQEEETPTRYDKVLAFCVVFLIGMLLGGVLVTMYWRLVVLAATVEAMTI